MLPLYEGLDVELFTCTIPNTACGLPVNGWIELETDFGGMWRAPRNVLDLVRGLDDITNNYESYRNRAIAHAESLSWYNRSIELAELFKQHIK